jgi:hypothetical protein
MRAAREMGAGLGFENTDAGARAKFSFIVEHDLGQGSITPQEKHQRALRGNKQ